MEKIIITGTKGFIGSNLKKELEGKYEIIEINEDIFNNVTWKDEVLKYFLFCLEPFSIKSWHARRLNVNNK